MCLQVYVDGGRDSNEGRKRIDMRCIGFTPG
jgi:hypothetical protein